MASRVRYCWQMSSGWSCGVGCVHKGALAREVERARIVLLAGDGVSGIEIAAKAYTSR